jgi:hypothetical protein
MQPRRRAGGGGILTCERFSLTSEASSLASEGFPLASKVSSVTSEVFPLVSEASSLTSEEIILVCQRIPQPAERTLPRRSAFFEPKAGVGKGIAKYLRAAGNHAGSLT